MPEQQQKESVQDSGRSGPDTSAIRPLQVKWIIKMMLEQGLEQGTHLTHVAGLLVVLHERNISLSDNQERELRALHGDALPAFGIAVHAKDASDFARKAGLTVDE